MTIKRNASVLLGVLALSSNTHQVKGHGVELLSCLTTTGNLRVFVRHWHNFGVSIAADAGAMVISTLGVPTTLVANGLINDVAPASLITPWTDLFNTGCSTSIVQENFCDFSLATYNDYVWYDFPTQCKTPVEYDFESGTTEVLMDGCVVFGRPPLYPTTISAQYTDSAPPVISVNGQLCSTGSIVLNASTKDCKDEVQVRFRLSAEDDCDPSPNVSSSPSSGSFFAVGSTTVTVTSTDSAGNTSTCTFTVIVSRDPELCSECLGCNFLSGLLDKKPLSSGSEPNPCKMEMKSMIIGGTSGRCAPPQTFDFSRQCKETNCHVWPTIAIKLGNKECKSGCSLAVYDDSELVLDKNISPKDWINLRYDAKPECECRAHRIKAVYSCPGRPSPQTLRPKPEGPVPVLEPHVLTQRAMYTCSECEMTPIVG